MAICQKYSTDDCNSVSQLALSAIKELVPHESIVLDLQAAVNLYQLVKYLTNYCTNIEAQVIVCK